MTDVANMLDLSNTNNWYRTLTRHQPEFIYAIIKVSEVEMLIEMNGEIKFTIVAEKQSVFMKIG